MSRPERRDAVVSEPATLEGSYMSQNALDLGTKTWSHLNLHEKCAVEYDFILTNAALHILSENVIEEIIMLPCDALLDASDND